MPAKVKKNSGASASVWQAARAVWRAEAEAVQGLADSLSPEAFTRCVDMLTTCSGRVLTTGCGTSAAAARKIAHSLCCIERPAAFLSPCDALHGGLGQVQREDIVIVISKGGNTRELTSMLPGIQSKRARIIAVTENSESALGLAADLLLRVQVKREPDPFNMLATASTMAVVALFDAVCIAVMKATGYTRQKFAVIHPGGAVGERLLRTKGRPPKPGGGNSRSPQTDFY
jgi:D-arabinose 5-phosphate isomerase GutQ